MCHVFAEDAGFFDEYVFSAYAAPWWHEPDGLDVETFGEWANATLSIHDPLVYPGVNIKHAVDAGDESATPASPDARLE